MRDYAVAFNYSPVFLFLANLCSGLEANNFLIFVSIRRLDENAGYGSKGAVSKISIYKWIA